MNARPAVASARASLAGARRVVVKVGSALLKEGDGAFARFAAEVAALWRDGREVVVVSSGAIALGLEPMGLAERPRDLASLQAAAACGQSRLMARWDVAFAAHGRHVAQILLTHADVNDRRRYLNAKDALERLLAAGVVPIVNENDTVAVEEIKFGDNDTLAGEVCGLVGASVVVLLTGADGLYTADPGVDPAAARVSVVEKIDDVRAMAGPPAKFGTGGMVTKLDAGGVAQRHGAATVIAPGRAPGVLAQVFAGADVGTVIVPDATPAKARKRWIATTLRPKGTLRVDDGCVAALKRNASLLFAGVKQVDGDFGPGDAVDVVDEGGTVVARGIVTLAARDAKKVAGLKTLEAQRAVGEPIPDELIHRDDLVLL